MPIPYPIDVWSVSLLADATQLDDFKKILSDNERQRAMRLRNIDHQRRAIVSAAKLRLILAQYLLIKPQAILYQYGEYGKPYIANYPIHFNMSHALDHCLIAVSRDVELGIDIELQRAKIDIQGLARKIFTPEEYVLFQQMSQVEQAASFYRTWTCKEALLKAFGTGLHQPLASIAVEINPKHPPLIKQLAHKSIKLDQISLETITVPHNYVAHIAILSPTNAKNGLHLIKKSL